MKDILWLVQNTLSVTFKQKKNIIMYLFMPLIGIFISLIAYGGDQKMILHVGVVNHDESRITSDTIKFLEDLENVKVTKLEESNVREKIISGELDSVITFDRGYSESVLQGEPNHIRLTSIKGAEVTGFIKSYLYQYIDNISTIGKIANGNQQAFDSMYKGYQKANFSLTTKSLADTSKNNDMTYKTIGFLIMIMLMSAGNMSEIILSEKENRTYFRLLSTPINARTYILSNVIVNMIVMIVQVLITLTVMTTIFHIDLNIPYWEAMAVMFLFALISVGISLLTTSFANNRSAAGALQNLIVLPTVMLSGCFWPVEVMPASIQKVANFLPQRWTLDTLTKLQDGNTLGSLYLNIMILLAFAAAFFLIAIYKFSRNQDTRNFV
ncbi:ABC transporter permease [Heyndrickxia sporothermodurans]|uniref:ABC transporter permease n=1 Tax=Heyndrickxia sporothermodurans TaxID=46224 RepID=A0AB37HRH7_9BACI|nr:ABC transporter permease [Heyndrickxia sporothermodurans]MBL5766694.1 ABC transporter permease [Heyndrickxia sporothermodurans]MBL5770130.1 ABC transporter permease [Heyndrickxia sporothermodurans]MBL5774269.1 ABC transporter permease [Heyndrickxia sporothermodurans]MBL5777787.1 ABC transporter permease [Heyndrickxia sporothermodurans]MBL5781007.1 ABC transporter permease [Heyndrickxia sporothermodurans]